MKKRTIIAASLVLSAFVVCILVVVHLHSMHMTQSKPVTTAPTGTKTGLVNTQKPKPTQHIQPPTTQTILGFYTAYNAQDQKSYRALQADGHSLNEMSTMTFTITSSGGIQGAAPANGLHLANSEQIASFAAIANQTDGHFDRQGTHQLLSNPAARQAAMYNALHLVKSNGYRGVNLDFENLLASDRPYFSQFVNDLAALLHQNGAQLIVSVMAKDSDFPKSNWVGAFDYVTIGRAADQVQLMTYDEHSPTDQPGAVASMPWVNHVLTYAVSQMPPHKILLGLAAYGYDWNLGNAKNTKAVAWKNLNRLIDTTGATAEWDATAQAPHFEYTAGDGSRHVVWYENTVSIEAKAYLVNQYNLAGIAMWHVGLEDQSFWQAVQVGLHS